MAASEIAGTEPVELEQHRPHLHKSGLLQRGRAAATKSMARERDAVLAALQSGSCLADQPAEVA